MKLYYSPGACSLSPHIVAKEAGLDVQLSRVTFDGAARTTAEGEDFFMVNPRGGYVPTLRRDDDSVLMEGAAIIQYLADQAPSAALTPEKGSAAYYDVLSWVTFISTELHKGFSPLYRPNLPESEKEVVVSKLKQRLTVLNAALDGKAYLMDAFTIADAYAYTIMRWLPRGGIDVAEYPNIKAFMATMETRPKVLAALSEEGLEPFVA